jgi:hypothetical protein
VTREVRTSPERSMPLLSRSATMSSRLVI